MPGIDEVRALFAAFMQRDVRVLQRIENCSAEVWLEDGQLVFSLAGLLALLEPQGSGDVRRFRQLLYASQLNQQLRADGTEIVVFHASGKVKSNLYCLKATSVLNSV